LIFSLQIVTAQPSMKSIRTGKKRFSYRSTCIRTT